MKEIVKNGTFLFLRVLIVTIMSLIVTVSIGVLMTAAFTENVGYTAYVYDENGKQIDEYSYKMSDGADKKYEEYDAKGYEIKKVNERSELKGTGEVLNIVLSQGISFIILWVFTYNKLFSLGNSDQNLVRYKHKTEDKLKGLKIGLVSVIPSLVLFIVIVICALGANKSMTVSLYTLPNFYLFGILRIINGGAVKAGDIAVWRYILIFLTLGIVPLISHLSYTLGYKDIFLMEKLMYKSKKE